jgi:hypothetical protein
MLAKAAYVYRDGPCSARAKRCSIEHGGTGIEPPEALAEQWPTKSTCQTITTIQQRQAAAPAVPGGGGARGSAGGGCVAALRPLSFCSLGARQRGWGLQHCVHRRSAHSGRAAARVGAAPRLCAKRRSPHWGRRAALCKTSFRSLGALRITWAPRFAARCRTTLRRSICNSNSLFQP